MSDDDLLARTRDALPKWLALYYQEPIELVRGEGARVWDGSGKEYLDFFGGIVTTISGHVVPKLVEALTEQANKIAHTSTVYLIRPMVPCRWRRWCQASASRAPSSRATRVAARWLGDGPPSISTSRSTRSRRAG